MIRWLALILFAVLAAPATADELRPGYLEFTEVRQGQWSLVWKAPVKGGITPDTRPVLPANCQNSGQPTRELSGAAVISKQQVTCKGAVGGGKIGLAGFSASVTDVVARVVPLDQPVQTLRLTAAEPVAEILREPSRWQVAGSYTVIGIEHIVFGWDHMLFVVALVLLLDGAWITILKAVTAFTIAHSITLIGSTLGFVGLPQGPVEIVIALSIIFLAVEIAKRKPGVPRLSERAPWVVAFLFGLLHGFGFAGALREIGLPEGEVPVALLTFNLGVELGQLAIVAATLAVLGLLRKFGPWLEPKAIRVMTFGIGSIASFWFVERILT